MLMAGSKTWKGKEKKNLKILDNRVYSRIFSRMKFFLIVQLRRNENSSAKLTKKNDLQIPRILNLT